MSGLIKVENNSFKGLGFFELGQIVATHGAINSGVSPEYVHECLTRHIFRDWGVVCAEDKASNDMAVEKGQESRVLSAYPIDPSKPCKGLGSNCLWIITEWDRSVTTILLPEEY